MKSPCAFRRQVLVLLACLASGASARSVRQLRTAPAAVAHLAANDLKPDNSDKETLVIEHNADVLLRFLDASAASASSSSRNASSSEATSAAAENTSSAPAPEPAPAPAPAPAAPAAVAAPQVPYEEFRVDCLAHVHQLVDNIDRSYTDVQMENVLKHECALESEFPASKEDGFHTEKACHEFAELLTKARHEELATGSQQGYEEFCQKYYEHRNAHPIGKPTAKPLYVSEVKVEAEPTTTTTTEEPATTTAAPKKEKGGISWKLLLILALLVACIIVGVFALRR